MFSGSSPRVEHCDQAAVTGVLLTAVMSPLAAFWASPWRLNRVMKARLLPALGIYTPTKTSAVNSNPPGSVSASTKLPQPAAGAADSAMTDAQSWAKAIIGTLDHALVYAHYDAAARRQYALFVEQVLAPALGPFPCRDVASPCWKSFMTDDHTPLELSFSFDGKSRGVRLSTEAISPDAGSPLDLLNTARSDQLISQLHQALPGMDLRWHDILREGLVVDEVDRSAHRQAASREQHTSQIFFGFDLERETAAVKMYYLPTLRAQEQGTSRLEVLSHMIPRLEDPHSPLRPAFAMLEDYIRSCPPSARPEVEIASVDCLDPTTSRLKTYVRNRQTSFRSVRDMFTLGGRLQDEDMTKTLHILRELWSLVLDLPREFDENEELDSPATQSHRTGGILYYFAVRPGHARPQPKIYIPVRHYARDDEQIAEGLAQAFRARGWTDLADSYVSNLQQMFPLRPLKAGRGLHTYICFSVKKGTATIEPYLNPGINSYVKAGFSAETIAARPSCIRGNVE